MLFIPDYKKNYKDKPIQCLPEPEVFHLPLYAYRGEMMPVVKPGEHVLKYQLMAHSPGAMGARIHAPSSGVVGETVEIGGKAYLKLHNDFQNACGALNPLNIETVGLNDFVDRLHDYGIEGSGGARFPTNLKYKAQAGNIDTVIINGAECEPYLCADYSLMKHFSQEIALISSLVLRVLNARRVVLAIERQHKSLKDIFISAFRKQDVPAEVRILPDAYPQGGELQLIKSITGLELAKGSIPADHGLIVNNVGTMYAMYCAFFEGKPYIKRLVTLYDKEGKRGGNYWLNIGTTISYLSRTFFSEEGKDKSVFVTGGPMMGRQPTSRLQSIDKGMGGVLLIQNSAHWESNCIGCGYCSDVCPQFLLPMEFLPSRVSSDSHLKIYNLPDCIECGACEYICPANIPLMDSIYDGKQKIN